MNLKLLLCLLFIAQCFVNCSEEDDNNGFAVTGRLTDSGKPVAGVRVDVDGLIQYESLTDANGEFSVTGVSKGSHTLNMKKVVNEGSFSSRVEAIDVTGDLTLNMTLPEPVTLRVSELAQSITENTVKLSWSPYFSDDFREYKVYAHNSSGLDETTGTLIHVTTNAEDTTFSFTLPHNANMYYRVFVLDETNQIAGSNVLKVSTPGFVNNPLLEIGAERAYYVNNQEELWFSFDATAGEFYGIRWYDQNASEAIPTPMEYTAASIWVSAWREDKITPYFYDDRLIPMTGCGYIVKAIANEKIYVKVTGFDERIAGTFGLKITPESQDAAKPLTTDGAGYSISVAPDDIKLLSFDAAAGKTYEINGLHPGKDGEFGPIAVLISVYSENDPAPLLTKNLIRIFPWAEPWNIISESDQKIFIALHGAFWYHPVAVSVSVVEK